MKKQFCILLVLLLGAFNLSAQQKPDSKLINDSTGFIKVDGGKLYFESAGTGENIVLIHDGMVHNEVWDAQFPVLAKNYHVVRYDRRGFGKSPIAQASYSNLEDLNQLFVQLKLDKALVFGMSAGGGLAIDFTLKYPEKVTGLVLTGAVVGGLGYTKHMRNRGGHMNLPASAFANDPEKVLRYFVYDDPYEIYAENKAAKDKVFKLLIGNLESVKGGGYLEKPYERPAVKFLSEIKVPALIIVGEFDIPDVQIHAGAIETGIQNSRLEIVPKSGHLVPVEQPEAFNTLVLKYLYTNKFNSLLNSEGAAKAVAFYLKRMQTDPSVRILERQEMHNLASSYFDKNDVKGTIEICRLYSIAYPESDYAFQFLADAYSQNGQRDLALVNYKKAVQLNPQNAMAKEMADKLENK